MVDSPNYGRRFVSSGNGYGDVYGVVRQIIRVACGVPAIGYRHGEGVTGLRLKIQLGGSFQLAGVRVYVKRQCVGTTQGVGQPVAIRVFGRNWIPYVLIRPGVFGNGAAPVLTVGERRRFVDVGNHDAYGFQFAGATPSVTTMLSR